MFVQLIFLALDTKSGIMMWRRRGETWKTSCRTWRNSHPLSLSSIFFMGTSGNQYSAAIDVFSEWSDEVNTQRCPVSSFGHLPDLLCVPLPSLRKISIIDCDGFSDTNEDVPPPLMQHLHALISRQGHPRLAPLPGPVLRHLRLGVRTIDYEGTCL